MVPFINQTMVSKVENSGYSNRFMGVKAIVLAEREFATDRKTLLGSASQRLLNHIITVVNSFLPV